MGLINAQSQRYELQARIGSPDGAAAERRAARLVQPRAAQHAVPRARPHRLHRDADGRRLDGAVDRAREGSRDDGAGADVADRAGAVRARQDGAVLRRLADLVDEHRRRRDAAVRPADARLVGRARRRRCRCSSSARLAFGLLISTIAETPAGGVSAGAADVVSADADALRLHLSDLEHAGLPAGRHAHRAGALLPGRAARHRAQGRRSIGCSGRTSVALAVFAVVDSRPGVAAAADGSGHE